MSELSYAMKEEECLTAFSQGGPYYLLSSPGLDFLMFVGDEDFKIGNNLIAVALKECRIDLLHYVIMNNHLHFVVEGMLLPRSFLSYRRTEQFFHSANQFFSYLYRQGEADVEIAHLIGESILVSGQVGPAALCGTAAGCCQKDEI